MKHDVAAGGERGAAALGDRAGQGIHRDVIAHQQALESDKPANHLAHHCDRSGGRCDGVDARKYNMCGHAERQAGKRLKGRKIGRFQGGPVGIDHRQFVVAVGGRPAMPRQVLEHRQDPAGHEPLRDRPGDGCDLAGLGSIGAVADHRVAAGYRHIRQRQAIHIDADALEVGRDQVAGKPSGGEPCGRLAVVERAIARARRIDRPMRRTEPLHPAAFLVHQNGRFPADDIAERIS